MDDLGGHELVTDAVLAFWAVDRLRGLEMGYVCHFGRSDGAEDALAELSGVVKR